MTGFIRYKFCPTKKVCVPPFSCRSNSWTPIQGSFSLATLFNNEMPQVTLNTITEESWCGHFGFYLILPFFLADRGSLLDYLPYDMFDLICMEISNIISKFPRMFRMSYTLQLKVKPVQTSQAKIPEILGTQRWESKYA